MSFLGASTIHGFAGRGCGKAVGVKSCEMLRDTYIAGSAAARHTNRVEAPTHKTKQSRQSFALSEE